MGNWQNWPGITASSSTSSELFGSIMGAIDCIAFSDGYMESMDSTYGCVLLRGRMVAAIKNWFWLHLDKINILSRRQ